MKKLWTILLLSACVAATCFSTPGCRESAPSGTIEPEPIESDEPLPNPAEEPELPDDGP